jgi:putative Holliday junction resolvase
MAVSDSAERVVTALSPLAFVCPTTLAIAVERLASEREIGAVVVGVPLTRKGEGRGEVRVAAVVAALRARLSIPVETEDERGTTQEALARLQEAGVPSRRQRDLVDGVAAQVILESHLAARQTP